MKTRITIWTCVGILAACTAGIVIWEIRRSGQLDLGHVYLLLFLSLFLLMTPIKILQAIAQARAEAGLPLPRWIAAVGPRLGWVYVCLFVAVTALYLYLERHEMKKIWDALLYWKVIITGHE